jgi:hypothetical protein
MTAQFVLINADVSVDWDGPSPNYRLYVGGELFSERTWIWREEYLEELIQIHAPPGEYEIRRELVPLAQGLITVSNTRIKDGPPGARIVNDTLLRIENEST